MDISNVKKDTEIYIFMIKFWILKQIFSLICSYKYYSNLLFCLLKEQEKGTFCLANKPSSSGLLQHKDLIHFCNYKAALKEKRRHTLLNQVWSILWMYIELIIKPLQIMFYLLLHKLFLNDYFEQAFSICVMLLLVWKQMPLSVNVHLR